MIIFAFSVLLPRLVFESIPYFVTTTLPEFITVSLPAFFTTIIPYYFSALIDIISNVSFSKIWELFTTSLIYAADFIINSLINMYYFTSLYIYLFFSYFVVYMFKVFGVFSYVSDGFNYVYGLCGCAWEYLIGA